MPADTEDGQPGSGERSPFSPDAAAALAGGPLGRERELIEDLLAEADCQLLALEQSRALRLARLPGRWAADWRGRIAGLFRSSGVLPATPEWRASFDAPYRRWVAREEAAVPRREWFAERQGKFAHAPFFSVLVERGNDDSPLKPILESLNSQLCPHWEVFVDAGIAAGDPGPSMRSVPAARDLSAVERMNAEAVAATGEYLICIKAGWRLSPYALHYIAEALQSNNPDLVYADEDRIDAAGHRYDPTFKPAWSPELLRACDYLGGFYAVRRTLLTELGGFRAAEGRTPIYDFALRAAERGVKARHIPRVLCHCLHPVRRIPRGGRGPRRPSGALLVSIIICSRNERLARRCLAAIDRLTDYGPREIVVVQHGIDLHLKDISCVSLQYDGAFNFSRMNNQAARAARGDLLVFLNDDVTPLSRSWLDAIVGQLEAAAGIVGGVLLYPSGAIQHAGIATGIALDTGHPLRDTFGSPFWKWSGLPREVSAVTGACLGIKKDIFWRLGGFDEAFPVNFNDVDLCLRAGAAGFPVVIDPGVLMRHDEGRTRDAGVRWRERLEWRRKWPDLRRAGDPLYSPHLDPNREDARLWIEEPHSPEDNSR